jgi:ElaB/YqjD/DUF883 family membrane-anchored ribosome-binding protein
MQAQEAITRTKMNGAAGNLKADMQTLVKDAQTMLEAAAALSGEKAEKMRGKGMHMLDQALGKAHEFQDEALVRGKHLAAAGDHYVKENPWKTIAAAAGVGLLLGVILGRK